MQGKRQLFTPDMTSMLAVQYNLNFKNPKDLKLFIRGEWKYLGRQYFDLGNTLSQSAYHLLNGQIGIEIKKVSIKIWAKNFANSRYISYAYEFGAVHLGDPATYGVTAQAHF
jgi:iron complex outermembrane receptor protein